MLEVALLLVSIVCIIVTCITQPTDGGTLFELASSQVNSGECSSCDPASDHMIQQET